MALSYRRRETQRLRPSPAQVGLLTRMAKKKAATVVRLVSQAGTGFFYTIRKAVRANAEKLQLMKHDPRVNAHVLFKEERIKK